MFILCFHSAPKPPAKIVLHNISTCSSSKVVLVEVFWALYKRKIIIENPSTSLTDFFPKAFYNHPEYCSEFRFYKKKNCV